MAPRLDIEAIFMAIQFSRVAVEHKVDELCIDLSLILQDLRGVTRRVNEAEKCISMANDDLALLKRQLPVERENPILKNIPLPSVPASLATELDLPLTEEEVDCAILALQAGKTWGPDDYPIEYYQRFRHGHLVPHLVNAYEEVTQWVAFPPGMDCATIVVIPISDLPRGQCSSYCPISQINTDSLFVKVLATWLAHILSFLVHPEQ
ncbi:hypothetical protein NDU88_008100 [Pleurodeles waltl]|uniref:Uncharacterized protein n=1 Tax=Pleurodeles waltl TaxID=8319 RepID=A0AAV7QQR8_PLEWA|nr:hypothetical protein NDU88_008100 [Pleurodeles waltl]